MAADDAELVELIVDLAASNLDELISRVLLKRLNAGHGMSSEEGYALLAKIERAIVRGRRRGAARGTLRPATTARRRLHNRCEGRSDESLKTNPNESE
jgi:hypothetical protein